MEMALSRCQDIDVVVTSPLRRCREFAERFCRKRDIELRVDARWREMDFGDWEGRRVEEVFAAHPEQAHSYYTEPDRFAPPAGEPASEVQTRVVEAFSHLLEARQGEHVLVIQHGGTTRLLLAHILAMPLSKTMHIDVPHACMTRVQSYRVDGDDFPVLVSHVSPPSVK